MSPKCNRMHVRGEMDFGFALARPDAAEKEKPGEAGLLTNIYFLSVHFASLAIACVRRETFRLALFL